MKVALGFAVTDEPIHYLEQKGFSFVRRFENDDFHAYTISFLDGQGFEIRQIANEDDYLQNQKAKNFEPFETEIEFDLSKNSSHQKNTVSRYIKALNESDDLPEKVKTYLRIRKRFDLWAIWLQCEDPKLFEQLAKPDLVFDWNGRPAMLIHLGPSCYDLIVTGR